MTAREALAAAASTIDGISCSPYYRQISKPGDACVRLASIASDDSGLGAMRTWQVWIALPQDIASAEQWLDKNHAAIKAALDPEWFFTSATPSQLVVGSSATQNLIVNGVIYEGARGDGDD